MEQPEQPVGDPQPTGVITASARGTVIKVADVYLEQAERAEDGSDG